MLRGALETVGGAWCGHVPGTELSFGGSPMSCVLWGRGPRRRLARRDHGGRHRTQAVGRGVGCQRSRAATTRQSLNRYSRSDHSAAPIARGTRQGHTIRQSDENRRKEKEKQNASGGGRRRKGEGRKENRKRRYRGKGEIIGGNAGYIGIIDTNNA